MNKPTGYTISERQGKDHPFVKYGTHKDQSAIWVAKTQPKYMKWYATKYELPENIKQLIR